MENKHLANAISDASLLERAKALVGRIVAERHDRPTLVSNIAREVGGEIIQGIRPAGADLNSVELSKRFRTSRTPIREVIMLLEKEGLVDVLPRKRPKVARPELPEIREIYQVRAVLYGMTATEVSRNVSASNLHQFNLLLREMDAARKQGNVNAYIWANVDFHDFNTRLAGNRTVKRMLDSMLLRTVCLRRISLSQQGRMAQSFDDHIRLLKAYEDHDEQLASALIRSNHTCALKALERYFADTQPRCAGVSGGPKRHRRRHEAA